MACSYSDVWKIYKYKKFNFKLCLMNIKTNLIPNRHRCNITRVLEIKCHFFHLLKLKYIWIINHEMFSSIFMLYCINIILVRQISFCNLYKSLSVSVKSYKSSYVSSYLIPVFETVTFTKIWRTFVTKR